MLTLQSRLRPNEEEVAGKVMDGEAIIINLSNGIYYSMDKVGGLIWELIDGRYSLEEMVTALCARYDVSAEKAKSDVERLLGELVQENLVLVTEDGAARGDNQVQQSEQIQAYESPKLNIYRDMGDLLALDPPTPGLENTPWKDPDEESSH